MKRILGKTAKSVPCSDENSISHVMQTNDLKMTGNALHCVRCRHEGETQRTLTVVNCFVIKIW